MDYRISQNLVVFEDPLEKNNVNQLWEILTTRLFWADRPSEPLQSILGMMSRFYRLSAPMYEERATRTCQRKRVMGKRKEKDEKEGRKGEGEGVKRS